jgi:ATP-dependent helicase Lhr and Lhr-like helicase
LSRGDRQLTTWLPEVEPERSKAARAVAQVLIDRARSGGDAPRGMLIEDIDGAPAGDHPLAAFLIEAGFVKSALGIVPGRRPLPAAPRPLAGHSPPSHRSVVSSPFARRYFDDSTDD